MSGPDRYGQGKATLITQHEKAEPMDDEVRWVDIQRAINKAMDEGQE